MSYCCIASSDFCSYDHSDLFDLPITYCRFFFSHCQTLQISYHKFNESERESSVLQRLRQGEIIALISDAGTPCISDPGMELVSCPFKDFLDRKNRHLW